VAFIVDDLVAWLVGLLADAGRKKLTALVLGSDQEGALRQATTAAIEATAAQLAPAGGERAGQLAMVVGEVFRGSPGVALAGQTTLLEAMQAGLAARLAVLDDPVFAGTGQSSAELLGVPGGVLSETLAGHLVREIMVRGAQGGPLAPLADQLNHDVTHLQGQRLQGMLAQLADQVRALSQADGSSEPTRKPVRLLPRPVFLAGREELLAEVGTRLKAGDDREPQLVALYGLGGAGKTSVAVEYAYRHLAEVQVAWQIGAEDATVLAAGFGELGAQLGIADCGDPVASVHGVLAAFPGEWLLVFDNAPDRASLQRFLPPAGAGRVLITSRNALWAPGQAVEVPVLDLQVAAGFLAARTGDADHQAAASLAEVVGGLPLALEQAAAYIEATGDSLAGYQAAFRKRRADLLSRGQPAGYTGTVAATWELAFTQVEQSDPGAAALLRLLAFCAPEAIPLRLLLHDRPGLPGKFSPQVAGVLVPLLEDELAASDAVAALRRYSLIRAAADGAVSVHRLVQAVTADRIPDDELRDAWRQAAAEVIEAALPDDPRQPGTWPVFAALLPHAQAALPVDSDGLTRIASYLGLSGSYLAAREFSRELAEERVRVLGAEDPGTLAARSYLAFWTGAAGDPAGARDQYAALLPITDRVLGAGRARALATRGNLARFTGEAGDAAGARDQYAALLPINERVLGPEHPDTLATRRSLACWTGEAGDAAGARDQYAALLPISEQVLGAEDPRTLSTRDNLAHWTAEAGDAAGARDQYAALLPVEARVLGPEHPDTLTARHRLANWTGMAGDAAGARDQYAALLPIRERVLGPEHPDTLATRNHLAWWTGEAGDAAGARDLYAALLPIRERVSGPEHPDTLGTRSHVPFWARAAGDAAGARDQFAALLPIRERVLGAEHPDTLATRDDLAWSTGEAGDAAGARDQFAALLPIRERVSGPEHPRTLVTATTSPASPARRGMRPRPVTCMPRCCPSASGSSVPSTRPPKPHAAASPSGPRRPTAARSVA
jgi:hypothetical protein